MGTYNTLHTRIACPRCGVVGEIEVELRLGNTARMQHLHVGDQYPWVPRVQPQNGGRPEGGNVDGEGYLECQTCHKDAFVRVLVRNDIIISVQPDTNRQGYIPD
jgi:hypothetical protein